MQGLRGIKPPKKGGLFYLYRTNPGGCGPGRGYGGFLNGGAGDVGTGAAICRLLCMGRGRARRAARPQDGLGGGRRPPPTAAAGGRPCGPYCCTGLRKVPRPGSKNPAPVLLPRRGVMYLLGHSTISSVPAPMSTQPIHDFGVNFSCRNTNASTSVKTTLNLSTGTTLQASPSCSAL